MNILLIYNRYNSFGGEDTYFNLVTNLLKKHGHKVVVFREDNRNIPNTLLAQIKVGLGLFYNPGLKVKLQSLIDKNNISVAILLNIYPLIGDTIYPLLKSRNIRILQRIANYRYVCPKMNMFRNGKICTSCIKMSSLIPSIIFGCYHNSRVASLIFSFSFHLHKMLGWFKLVDAYIFPSRFIADIYKKNGVISTKKVHIIPSFIDSRQAYNAPKRSGVVFVGRLVEEKGILKLLKIVKYFPKITFTIVGSGPLEKEVLKYVRNNNNIEFLSFLNKKSVIKTISSSKVVIFPSLWYDVLPNVLIESYATGTPVVAPNMGVFKHLIKINKTGWLYDPDSPQSFRRAIQNAVYNTKNMAHDIQKESKIYRSSRHYDALLPLLKRTNE